MRWAGASDLTKERVRAAAAALERRSGTGRLDDFIALSFFHITATDVHIAKIFRDAYL
jgi:hypothetical protein